MACNAALNFDPAAVPSPCYVCDEGILQRNLEKIKEVRDRTHCRVLLALKGFALFSVFPLIRRYLQGVCASSPHEARLGYDELGGEVHVYAPAYSEADLQALLPLADHIIFNSFNQRGRFRSWIEGAERPVSCGLRVNPEYSEVEVDLYNPCARYSRLGITAAQFPGQDLSGVEGLHFHTLCEQNADALERTVAVFEEKFGAYLEGMKWVNFGGGHHISRADYDRDRLCRIVEQFAERHQVQVYLEPGEAVALHAGYLVASVLDVVYNEMDIAILDTSATAHMPDVLEMPYRPDVMGAGAPGELAHTYRLGGLTCLAGDVIGDYSFREPLKPGDRLVFEDMAHYTMVKSTTFNGVQLPAIAVRRADTGRVEIVREFEYSDYRHRLS